MKKLQIAKITRPKLAGIFGRSRLFRLLDLGRQKPIVWIAAQAGSGKTTLVASYLDSRRLPCLWYQVDEGDDDIASFFYHMGLAARKAAPQYKKPMPLLTPEYLQGVSTFTRRYFEELFRRLLPLRSSSLTERGTGDILVLDNFQDASSALFHEFISHGLETIPEGINVVVLSRSEPPAAYSRLRANNKIAIIGWNEIKFTHQECRAFLKGKAGRTFETIKQLHDRTDGWVAGLVLMTEMTKTKEIPYPEISQLSREAVFNYFANEIFEKTDSETRDFLLKTSFFPSMSVAAAKKLTGNAGALTILSRLSRDHYFTDCRSLQGLVFQYHPLFREFLQARAKGVFEHEKLAYTLQRTGVILEEEGRTDEAAALYIAAESWENLIRLTLACSQTLTSQGRSRTLEEWILRVPAEIRDVTPQLLYWLGVCRLSHVPSESREYFEKAYLRFCNKGDTEGQFLAWAGIVNAFVYDWGDFRPLDRWIEWLHEKFSQGLPPLSPEIEARVVTAMFMAMVYRQPSHPDIEFWLDRSLSLALKGDDINLSLQACSIAANYFFWIGDFDRVMMVGSKIGEFDRSTGVSPLHKIVWRFVDAANDLCFAHSLASAATKLNDAIKIADETGVHIWDHMLMALGVYSANLQGDAATAEKFLKKMKPFLSNSRLHLNCQYHALTAWCAVLRGDNFYAVINAEIALKLAEETGFIFPQILCLLELANILQTDRRYGKSKLYLDRAQALSSKTRSPLFQFACLLARARIELDAGRKDEGLLFLSDAMHIGNKKGYLGLPWWWQPSVMAELCARALEYGIETEYVSKLIRKRGLLPGQAVEAWPYPIKIYTFGSFRLLKDGEAVQFTGKVQRKPLEMVKVLTALGGEDIPEEQITEALWPDAEGDAAHKSFEITLYRLRLLLGNDKALRLQNGLLSFDRRYCWVDALEFEEFAGASDRVLDETEVKLLDKAAGIYQGHFLASDSAQAWSVSMRERLRRKYHRLILSLGGGWEEGCRWEKALEYYHKGLETDELVEEFYQRLMVCHM